MTPVAVVAVAAEENYVACSLVVTIAASLSPILAVTADVAVAAVENCEECSLVATAVDATRVALDGRPTAVAATPDAVADADAAASFVESSDAVQNAVAIHVDTSTSPLDTNTETPVCKAP